MGVNGRGLGRFSFRPKSPQKGRGHLKPPLRPHPDANTNTQPHPDANAQTRPHPDTNTHTQPHPDAHTHTDMHMEGGAGEGVNLTE